MPTGTDDVDDSDDVGDSDSDGEVGGAVIITTVVADAEPESLSAAQALSTTITDTRTANRLRITRPYVQ